MHRLMRAKCARKLAVVAVGVCFSAPVAWSNPIGPQVINGSASISQQGNLLSIINTPNAIINWQGFSIGRGEITRFIQQSAASSVLNRVAGVDPSIILGTLQSNGRVFLINPNGVLFGAGAQIDVAGLVASTLNLSNVDFLAGRLRFTETPGAGSVVNQGTITTPGGGSVYLVAPNVENHGIIQSPQGEVILAAGKSVELVDAGTPNLHVQIDAPDNQALNVGQIIANSGRIGIYAGLIKNGGELRADGVVVGANGEILLKATRNITTENGSIISASGAQGGTIKVEADGLAVIDGSIAATGQVQQGGAVALNADVVMQLGAVRADGASGGEVTVKARNVLQAGTILADGNAGAGGRVAINAAGTILQTKMARVSASGFDGIGGSILFSSGNGNQFLSGAFNVSGERGGSIEITGTDLVLAAARLDASGMHAGGTVLIGGDAHGANPNVPNATNTTINSATTINADAIDSGDAGKVVVWSDQQTKFYGNISARGGAQNGDGGFIEVSGKENLSFGGFADAGAPNGAAGILLLDPKNVIIDAAGGGPSVLDLIDAHIGANDQFGLGAIVLTNGNIVAPDSNDDFVAINAGAVSVLSG